MKEGPDISRIATMIGEPARANMLIALMSGKALTARELADEAGVTPATASSHLRKLQEAGLIWPRAQGRHRYFTLAGADVAQTLEALIGLAAARGHLRTRTGPRDPALRQARVCYDHLAGAQAVRMFDSMAQRGLLQVTATGIALTPAGQGFVMDFGVAEAAITGPGRPVCRACLDWSERRDHLAGRLGAALLTRITKAGWARRQAGSRVIEFTPKGQSAIEGYFPLAEIAATADMRI